MLTLLAIAAMPIGLSLIVHVLPGAAGDDSPMAREQRKIFEESLRENVLPLTSRVTSE